MLKKPVAIRTGFLFLAAIQKSPVFGMIGRVTYLVMLMHAVIDKLISIVKVQKRIPFPLFIHGRRALVRVVMARQGEGRVR